MKKIYTALAISIFLTACSSSSDDDTSATPVDDVETSGPENETDAGNNGETTDAETDPTGIEGQLRNSGTQQDPIDIWRCDEFRALGFYNTEDSLFGVLETDTLSATEASYSVNDNTGDVTIVILTSSQTLQLSAPQFADSDTFDAVLSDGVDEGVNVNCLRVTL